MTHLTQSTSNWIRPYTSTITHKYRKITWRNRADPDFIIIGAQKSGTSSMFYYLSQHPQLISSYKKEVHFFDGGLTPYIDNFKKGKHWYRTQFPLKRILSNEKKFFEASPFYIFNPLTAKRIYNHLPKVKIIALLRNPTERAISHYFHSKFNNQEKLPINEALHKEELRLANIFEKQDYKNKYFIHYSYKQRGLYKIQLERYFNEFSRKQILVLDSESFFSDPERILKEIFEFVEVDTDYNIKNLTPMNVTTNKSFVAPHVYKYLDQYFFPHNQALYDFVDINFSWNN